MITFRSSHQSNRPVPHCENCGRGNPTTHRDDGYTECCNELVCYGEYQQSWTDGKQTVEACCGAMASEEFKRVHGKEPVSFHLAH